MILLSSLLLISCRGEVSEPPISSDSENTPAITVGTVSTQADAMQTAAHPSTTTSVSPVWLAVMEFVWSEEDRAYLVAGVSEGVEKVFIPYAYNPPYEKYGTVIGVKKEAFAGDAVIKQLTMEKNIKRIEEGGFRACIALEEVYCAATLTEIGKDAFRECVSLTRIELPDGLLRIGEGAFYGCRSLEQISLPKGICSIGVGAFDGIDGLTVSYAGTVAEWNAVVGAAEVRCTVICTDGRINA